jgi:tetratricopeptide (TPR) repeat protein
MKLLATISIISLFVAPDVAAQPSKSEDNFDKQGRALVISGQDLHEQSRYLEAIKVLDAGLKQYPNSARLLYDRGVALLFAEQYQKSFEDLRRCECLQPTDSKLMQKLAELLQLDQDKIAGALREQGRLDEALKMYDYLIQRSPKVAAFWFGRGRVKHDKGDSAGATADFEEAASRNPIYKRILNGVGLPLPEPFGDFDKPDRPTAKPPADVG